jgi:ElaB/YqjD/DUF883 family membrane-anchored ribosome-binding protein
MDQFDDAASLRDTANAAAASIASEFSATLDAAGELARAAGKLADQRVRQRPWETALIAGAIGLLLGLSIRGR